MTQPEKSPERQQLEQKVRLGDLTDKLDSGPIQQVEKSPPKKIRPQFKPKRVAAWAILISMATMALLMLFGATYTVLGLLSLAMVLLFVWAVVTLLKIC